EGDRDGLRAELLDDLGLFALTQQPGQVQAPVAECGMALSVSRPMLGRAIPAQLQPVLLRVAEVNGLVRAVFVEAVDRPIRVAQSPERIAQRSTGCVADRQVVEASRAWRRWRSAFRLPGVEPK